MTTAERLVYVTRYPTTIPRRAQDAEPVPIVADRERWHFLAAYYAWSARRADWPTGNDPTTGRPWPRYNPHARRIARAQNVAAAREAYAIAAAYGPTPVP